MARPSNPHMLRIFTWATLAALLPRALAQQKEIECIVPHEIGIGQRPVYSTGENVQFRWKSDYPEFNMSLVQVSSLTQAKTYNRLFENQPNTTANLFWTAANMDGLSQDDPMHLWIVNARDKECETCHCRSANFTVLDAANPTSSATSSLTYASSSRSAGASGDDDNHTLALGLGLGLGIPLLIIVTALTTFICICRRRRITNTTYSEAVNSSPSSSLPLKPYLHDPSSLGWLSSSPGSLGGKKSPIKEMDGIERQVVEAPGSGGVRVELEGHAMDHDMERRM